MLATKRKEQAMSDLTLNTKLQLWRAKMVQEGKIKILPGKTEEEAAPSL